MYIGLCAYFLIFILFGYFSLPQLMASPLKLPNEIDIVDFSGLVAMGNSNGQYGSHKLLSQD